MLNAQTGTPQYLFTPSGAVNTGNSTPLAYQTDNRSQILFPGNIFPTAPAGMGITAIYFSVYSSIAPPATQSHTTYTVHAGNAPGVNTLTTASFYSTSNLTKVIDQPGYTYYLTGGVNLKIPFSTIAPYDPSQPLIIDFQWTGRTGSNWYLNCSSTAQAGFNNTYAPSPTATAPTAVQSYVYIFGIDLAPLPSNIPKIPPLANFKPMYDADTLWTGSPSVLVNTSSYSDTNYWAITGYNATSASGPWDPYSNSGDVIHNNLRGSWIDTVTNKLNFYYTFSKAGYYRIKLFTANRYGTSYVEKAVYVSNPLRKPKAMFFANKRVVPVYDRVQFNDLSQDGPTKWKWWLDPPCYTCGLYKNEFYGPNGKNDTISTPYLQAADAGPYKVCLAVSNSVGSDTLCQSTYLKVIPGYQMCNGSDSVGTTSEGAVMPTQTGSLTPQYIASTCSQGFKIMPCSDTITVTLDRLRLRKNGGPTAPGDSLYLKASLLPGSAIYRRWGGSELSTYPDSMRTFKFTGQQLYLVYTPVAPNTPTTLVNDSGFLVRWTSTAATYARPKAIFNSPDTIFSGYKVQFKNASQGKYPNYAWDIDNDGVYGNDNLKAGKDSTVASPTMVYNVTLPTLKTVCLRTYNCVGSDTMCKTFLVLPTNTAPFADFSANKTYGLTSDTFQLIDRSYNGANSWKWKFEPANVTYIGGTDSTSQNPMVFLNTNTGYTITLTCFNAFGSSIARKANYITTISYPSPGSQFTPTSSIEDFGITRVKLTGSIGRIDTITPLKPTDGSAYLGLFNLSKTTLYRGGKYTVDVYRGSSPADSMNLRVWLDFNRNANYLDAGETLISEDKKLQVKYSKDFVVPASAAIGVTRLLVGASAGFSTITPYSSVLGVYQEHGIIIGNDLVKPVVTLKGSTVAKTELGKPYIDAGATATDNIEGDITSRLVTINNVDISHVGYYTMKYVVSDYYGNVSDTVTRLVQVEINQTGPKITLKGKDTVYLEVRVDSYVDSLATAVDNSNNDITSSMLVSTDLDTSRVNTYHYTFTVFDAFGFSATKRRVIIVKDSYKPVCVSRTGNNTVSHQIHTAFDDNVYVRVDDNYWTDIVPIRIPGQGELDVDKAGIYVLKYRAIDGSGNMSDTMTLNVKITNNIKPVITLVGGSDLTLKVFENFKDPMATAKDYSNNIIQVELYRDNLDINHVGDYTRVYIATDAFGQFDTISRNLHVKDLDGPVITILGENPVVVVNGTMLPEQIKSLIDNTSVKVSDNYDDKPVLKENSNLVPLDKPGTYQITYDATDRYGNKAQQKQRFLQIMPATSINTIEASQKVSLYPNPTRGIFNVEIKNSDVKSVKVYNIAGVMIKELHFEKSGVVSVDLSNESEGIYLVKIEGADTSKTIKVNVTR